jgi:hypothetical protein
VCATFDFLTRHFVYLPTPHDSFFYFFFFFLFSLFLKTFSGFPDGISMALEQFFAEQYPIIPSDGTGQEK